MTICVAFSVPDGIALAADSQTTWMETTSHSIKKGTQEVFELESPIVKPVGWSRMAKKLFKMKFGERHFAFCIAGSALINKKTIYSIFKSMEKRYSGTTEFSNIVPFVISELLTEIKKDLGIENVEAAN